ncbi:MAG: amidohydrolase family protein [Candidatus Fermentibacteraceae bacterium]
MKTLSCGSFWPGAGPVLSGVRLSFDRGRVVSVEKCSGGIDGLVMPSFIDGHMHFSWKASTLSSIDLSGVSGSDHLLSIVGAAPSSSDPILRCSGFDDSSWSDPALPSLAALDAVSGDRPVVLTRVCGHLSLVNSALLRLVPPGTPDVDRTAGRLTESASLGFSRLFPVPGELLSHNMEAFQDTVFSCGVTGMGTMEHLREADIIGEWGPLLRTAIGIFSIDAPALLEREPGRYARWIKLFLDGTFGAGDAAVEGAYPDGSSVFPIMDDEEVAVLAGIAGNCGMGVCAHAIGARAIRQALAVSAFPEGPEVRVEHAEELLPVIEDLHGSLPEKVSFCMQPNFVSRWQMPGGMYGRRMSADGARGLNPFASVLSRGLRLGFGSDGMPFGPLNGLSGATHHPSPDQRLSVEQALHAYTLGAADVCGFFDLAGVVAPGRPGHLCVLSADPFRGVPWDEVSVEATILDGAVVFGDPGILGEA